MDIYMDLVLLLNFLVDFLLLYGTNKLAGFPASMKRAALAAAVGAAYAGMCILPGFSFLASGFWRFTSFLGMTLIAFGISKSALQRGVVFFLLSMALGGLAMGIGSQTVWAIVLAAACLWLMCLVGFGGRTPGSTYVPVSVSCKGKTLKLTALLDTGNTLKDPLSGKPVLVMEDRAAFALLSITPQELKRPLETITSGKYPGLRLIPYNAVGQPVGMLLGIRPDNITVNGKKADMIVAFAPQRIGQGRPFEALAGGMI